MNSRGAGFGLDAELAKKRESNYDYTSQHEAQAWIESVIGEQLEGSFAAALKDGVKLCKLINTIKPGSVAKINESKMPFKQMENVSNFIRACRALGTPEHSLFETVDLYEEKALELVVKCLFALGGAVQRTVPEFAGPHLGVGKAAASTAHTRKGRSLELAAAKLHADIAKLDEQEIAAAVESVTLEPSPEQVDSSAPAATSVPEPTPPVSAVTSVAASPTLPPLAPSRDPSPTVVSGGRGGGYGLDAEIARKQSLNYDYNAEAQAQWWIENVTGIQFTEGFGPSLKDGVLLCKLVNTIKPGSVARINESKMPFKQMENISNFLKACRALGVQEHSLFETVDLFEEKALDLVVKCLLALGGAVQKSCPDFPGPYIGVKESSANVRAWTNEERAKQRRDSSPVTKMMAGSVSTLEVVRTGITAGADYSGASIAPGSVSLMTLKTPTVTMEVVKTGITAGADYSGPSLSPGSLSLLALKTPTVTMEVVKTGITAGAEYSGPSLSPGSISLLAAKTPMEKLPLYKPIGADQSPPSNRRPSNEVAGTPEHIPQDVVSGGTAA